MNQYDISYWFLVLCKVKKLFTVDMGLDLSVMFGMGLIINGHQNKKQKTKKPSPTLIYKYFNYYLLYKRES